MDWNSDAMFIKRFGAMNMSKDYLIAANKWLDENEEKYLKLKKNEKVLVIPRRCSHTVRRRTLH